MVAAEKTLRKEGAIQRMAKEEELYLWLLLLFLFVTNNFVLHKILFQPSFSGDFKKCFRYSLIVMGDCAERLLLLHPNAHT